MEKNSNIALLKCGLNISLSQVGYAKLIEALSVKNCKNKNYFVVFFAI